MLSGRFVKLSDRFANPSDGFVTISAPIEDCGLWIADCGFVPLKMYDVLGSEMVSKQVPFRIPTTCPPSFWRIGGSWEKNLTIEYETRNEILRRFASQNDRLF